jgi:hypothetical protein
MHLSSTRFPQAFTVALFFALLTLPAVARAQGTGALLFRILLKDGSSLVSYGEFARVAGRVLIQVPVGEISAEPKLQVISIDEALVDWPSTEAYAETVRAKRYAETQGENDFALLTGQVTIALNDIAMATDPARRLAMAQEARGNLAAWPSQNYGFKAAEVAQLVSIFDDVIAEMKAEMKPGAGGGGFDLSLVAMTLPPLPAVLLPAPDVRTSLELAYRAAMLSPEPAERTALLQILAESLAFAPTTATWAPALRTRVSAALAVEQKADRAYAGLVTSTLKEASARAARGEVNSLQAIIARSLRTDDALGRKRPGEMSGLLATLDMKLAEAQRVRLEQDARVLRLDEVRHYEKRIASPLERIGSFRKWLESIRALAGPDPRYLRPLDDRAALALSELASAGPPPEAQPAHQLFVASLQMTRQAAALRRKAVSSNDINLARDAASAATGALALGARAAEELKGILDKK